MSEREIQNAVCEYLEKKKYFFWRQNNTPVFDTKRKVFRKMPKYAMKGVPDIQVVVEGGFSVYLEVKKKGGYQSKEQKIFEKKIKDLGGEYYVIRSLDDVRLILK